METKEAGPLFKTRTQIKKEKSMDERKGPPRLVAQVPLPARLQPRSAPAHNSKILPNGVSDYDCELCGGQSFLSEQEFIAHMTAHGYRLSSEEELARIERREVPNRLMPAVKVHHPHPPPTPSVYGRWEGQSVRCVLCGLRSPLLAQHIAHVAAAHRRTATESVATFPCQICNQKRFLTQEELSDHEKSCEDLQLLQRRTSTVTASGRCRWCPRVCATHTLLAGHILTDHANVLAKIRSNRCMVGELLPFRCSVCCIGFETPRLLTNHFRARELLGIPCRGELIIHDYQTDAKEIYKKQNAGRPLPADSQEETREEGDEEEERKKDESDGWIAGPYDPPPYLPPLMDVHTLVECSWCAERWPVAQLKLHVKHEHPVQFFEKAPFRCNVCKQVKFYCPWRYAEHWESCSPSSPGPIDESLSSVAPRRCEIWGVKMRRPQPFPLLENAGNEVRACRFCSLEMSPRRLLQHMKESHPLHHFTDAPYPCPRCGEVAFYAHEEYKMHAVKCDGSTPVNLVDDPYAIVLNAAEWKKENSGSDFVTYRTCFDGYRKRGTLAAIEWKQVCTACPESTRFVGSLRIVAGHLSTSHRFHSRPLVCAGCDSVFHGLESMTRHAKFQNVMGNTQCFGKARVSMNPTESTVSVNLNILKAFSGSAEKVVISERDSVFVRYWKEYLKLKKYRIIDCPKRPQGSRIIHIIDRKQSIRAPVDPQFRRLFN